MEKQEFDVFVHRADTKPSVISGGENETLEALLKRTSIAVSADEIVFIGECDEALGFDNPDDNTNQEDRQEPVELRRSLKDLDLRKHLHIHIHHCRRVAVEVHLAGKSVHRKFSPATTVGVVAQWARRKLRLDRAAGAEYVLRICNSKVQPRPDEHIGELTNGRVCALCFDLVKEITPQG